MRITLIETLIFEAAVEALCEGILSWLTRLDVVSLNICFLKPFEKSHTGQLCPIIADNSVRLSSAFDKAVKFSGDTLTWQ